MPGQVTRVRPVRLVAPGVALVALCYGIARFAYGLFVPVFRIEFALSDTLLGLVGAASYVGYCVAIVAASAAVGRVGPRPVAAAAGIVATGGDRGRSGPAAGVPAVRQRPGVHRACGGRLVPVQRRGHRVHGPRLALAERLDRVVQRPAP